MNDLLESIQTALIMEYSVRFSSLGFTFYVELPKDIDTEEMLKNNTACLPMDGHHFDQERISDVIDFLIKRDNKQP